MEYWPAKRTISIGSMKTNAVNSQLNSKLLIDAACWILKDEGRSLMPPISSLPINTR